MGRFLRHVHGYVLPLLILSLVFLVMCVSSLASASPPPPSPDPKADPAEAQRLAGIETTHMAEVDIEASSEALPSSNDGDNPYLYVGLLADKDDTLYQRETLLYFDPPSMLSTEPFTDGPAQDSGLRYDFVSVTGWASGLSNQSWFGTFVYPDRAPANARVAFVEFTIYSDSVGGSGLYCPQFSYREDCPQFWGGTRLTDYAGEEVNQVWVLYVRGEPLVSPPDEIHYQMRIYYEVPTTPLPTPTKTNTPVGFHSLNVPVIADSHTSQGSAYANFGHESVIVAGMLRTIRAWFKFDVAGSGIPAGAAITKATMYLYSLGAPYGNVDTHVYVPLGDWTEYGISWINQPGYDPASIASVWVPVASPSWYGWNIAPMVAGWVNGDVPNYGVMVADYNDTNTIRVASKEDALHRQAYLHVEYTAGESPTNTPTPTATPTRTLTRTATVTLTPTTTAGQGAAMALSPAGGSFGVNQTFLVDIVVDAGSQQVDAVQAFLNFDPAFLTVVDASGNPTNQIIAGSGFSSHFLNTVNNATGQIDYSDGQLSGDPLAGSFTVGTIRFKAKQTTQNTLVTFSRSFPRESKLTSAGANVLGSTGAGNYAIVVVQGSLAGSMRLQGRPNPPSSLLAVPLVVKFYSPGGSTPLRTGNVMADNNGNFTVADVINGVYDLTVKNAQTLSVKKQNITFSGGVGSLDFGILREGDANDDDIVDVTDFSILRTTFLKSSGQSGFDGRADFNGDNIVDVTDFSLLRSNFLGSGPIVASPGLESRNLDAVVTVSLNPSVSNVTVNQIFTVQIDVGAGSQLVDAAQVVLTFNPALVHVVDDGGNDATSITAGSAMDTHLSNQVDNVTGRIVYTDGQLSGSALTGSFTLATVRFKAVGAGSGAVSAVTVGQVRTKMSYGGVDQEVSVGDAIVNVGGQPTPTTTPTNTPTNTPTGTATNTPSATPANPGADKHIYLPIIVHS